MANSGFYTFVDDQIAFPFGTKNMNLSNQRIEWFMRLKGGVFLSDTSIKEIDSTLIKTGYFCCFSGMIKTLCLPIPRFIK